MLNLIPLGCSRRKVGDLYWNSDLIYELLQFNLKQAVSASVTSSSICCDVKLRCIGIPRFTHLLPPRTYGSDCKLCGIRSDAYIDVTFILEKIVDAIRNSFTFFGKRKIMVQDLRRFTFRGVFSAIILEISDVLFFLTIDRDHRLIIGHICQAGLIDMLELRIPIR